MAFFLTKLTVTQISPGDAYSNPVWAIVNPLVYQSDVANTTITVPTGFQTEFASVPKLPFLFSCFGDIADSAATIHDYIYTEKSFDRLTCDKVFQEAMKVVGVNPIKRKLMYWAVRAFGDQFYGTR